jgi:DeoR/GlpR family transcriptional regulator of sugar metabolism
MLELADEAILLADHSKLGLRSSFYFAGVGEADLLLTDAGADRSVVGDLEKAGLKVQIV